MVRGLALFLCRAVFPALAPAPAAKSVCHSAPLVLRSLLGSFSTMHIHLVSAFTSSSCLYLSLALAKCNGKYGLVYFVRVIHLHQVADVFPRYAIIFHQSNPNATSPIALLKEPTTEQPQSSTSPPHSSLASSPQHLQPHTTAQLQSSHHK